VIGAESALNLTLGLLEKTKPSSPLRLEALNETGHSLSGDLNLIKRSGKAATQVTFTARPECAAGDARKFAGRAA
jgi:hypothetical protein